MPVNFLLKVPNCEMFVSANICRETKARMLYTHIRVFKMMKTISRSAVSMNFSCLLLSLVSGDRRLKALADNAVQ